MPSVFISYSHDLADPTHADRVAGLTASLLRDGLKVFLDQNRGDEEEGAAKNPSGPLLGARPEATLEHLHVIQKSRFLETEETLANDDVIQKIDLKNLCSGHYTPGELHIRLRRTRVA